MKKRSKKLLILLLVLAVLAAGTVLVLKLVSNSETGQEDTPEESVSLLDLDSLDILALNYKYGDRNLTFNYSKDGWEYSDDPEFPLDNSKIDSMFTKLCSLSYTKHIDNVSNPEEYGLSKPLCEISILASNSVHILLGNETGLGGERYVSIDDGSVYLVDADVLNTFDYDLYDLIKPEDIPAFSSVLRLTVDRKGHDLTVVKMEDSGKAYSDKYYWFLQNGSEYTTLDNESTSSFVSNFTSLSFKNCINYKADEDALREYGLADPAFTVTCDYSSSADTKASFTLEYGDSAEEGTYVRIPGSSMVYLVENDAAASLYQTDPASLLPDDVILMDWSKVTGFEIGFGGNFYEIARNEENDTVVWDIDGDAFDADTLFAALDELRSSGSAENSQPAASQITFVFYQDSYHYPKVTLAFSPYDSSDCLETLNGESRLLVPVSEITDLLSVVDSLLSPGK